MAMKMEAVSFLGCTPMAPACGASLNLLLIQPHEASQHLVRGLNIIKDDCTSRYIS